MSEEDRMRLEPMHTVDEVFAVAAELRDELETRGELDAARELTETIESFYTTGSEALSEVLRAFEQTRDRWERHLTPGYRARVEHAIREATRMFARPPGNP